MDQILTKEVFKENPYIKKCDSLVVDFKDNWIQLDQTIFYAEGGGQLGDTGFIKTKDRKIEIINTIRNGTFIKHITNEDIDLNINDKVFTASVSENNNLILKLIKKNETTNMLWGTTRSIVNSA